MEEYFCVSLSSKMSLCLVFLLSGLLHAFVLIVCLLEVFDVCLAIVLFSWIGDIASVL